MRPITLLELTTNLSYADKYFKKRIKKFITEVANLCEARLLVFTIRDSGIGKKKWVSV